MEKTVFVIIPVYNRKAFTRACLMCLCKQTYTAFQTIIVDDGSTDGTREMLERDFPEIIRLQGDGGLFWTGGTNRGVQHALDQGADLIVTLNNDVWIKEDYIENLVSAHKNYPDALIGSINLTQEDPPRLLYAGIQSFNPWTAKFVKRGTFLKPYRKEFSGLLPTHSLPGRGVLIPRNVFKKIGLFDDKYLRHYAADYDFSLRAKKAGFDLLVNMDNPVFSPYEPERDGGKKQTFSRFVQSFFKFRSSNYLPINLRFLWRHYPYKLFFPIYFFIATSRNFIAFFKAKN